MALPLRELDVLVVDCQATAAAPRGHLLEIGWACAGATTTPARARLIRLPDPERIPPGVARITGITDPMVRDGLEPSVAWRELSEEAARLSPQPAPTIVHFARFEQPFLGMLAGGVPPLDIICTHEIARRLLPDLPRRSLRALAGYFGRGVGTLRRSASHVEATAFVWRELLELLDVHGVKTWTALRKWLQTPVRQTKAPHRVWPLPRDVRLSLPDAPGIYRMLRRGGDVLYVGKASSLHHRVNSYFRKQSGVHERTLEMLSQARAISFEVAPSTLEAALLEADEIKKLQPPYNVALAVEDRAVWFAAQDLSERSRCPSPRCPLGPFPAAEVLDQFAALAREDSGSLARGRWGPEPSVFHAGFSRFRAAHPELWREDLSAPARLLRLGTRLWREGRRDRAADVDDEPGTSSGLAVWTPEHVQVALEWLVLRGSLARRRARWLTRLVDATLVWCEPGVACARLIVVEDGEVITRAAVAAGTTPPVPPGARRSASARRAAFSVARFDRLRVLSTELKRLVADGAPVALRFGSAPPLAGRRLARVLAWV